MVSGPNRSASGNQERGFSVQYGRPSTIFVKGFVSHGLGVRMDKRQLEKQEKQNKG